MWVVVTIVGSLAGAAWLYLAHVSRSMERRENFSLGPLGLKSRVGRRRPAKHSILCLKEMAVFDDYLRVVDSRSVRATMRVQIDKAFATHELYSVTKTCEHVSWKHFAVIHAHERRVYGPLRAVLVALLRFLAISLMVGTLDEYYCGTSKELVAFTSTIVKGRTMRAMWFYQRPEHAHHMIWFHSLRASICRALALKLHHLDLGPSIDDGVARLKEKYGFAYVDDWREQCSYDGPFVHQLPSD
jgi:hypothetical protein